MPRSGNTQSAAVIASSSSTTSAATAAAASVRERRKPKLVGSEDDGLAAARLSDPVTAMPSWTVRNRWIVYAIASGACAAFNGVFAKLTTNELSTNIAQGISGLLGLNDLGRYVEVIVRCSFFGLNLAFNGVMWTLFTQALAKGNSTTQVSIMNTSTNFVITALLGLAIFSESLPPLWWAGATLLVAGNVIIGRGKQEDENSEVEPVPEAPHPAYHDYGTNDVDDEDAILPVQEPASVEGVIPVEKDDEDEDVPLIGDLS